MITKEQLNQYIEIQTQIENLAEDYISNFLYQNTSLEGFSIDGDNINITVSEGCMGCYESNWYEFPAAYLWDADWKTTEKIRKQEAKKKAEIEKANEAKLKEEEAEKREYDRFLKMKEKYGETV